MILLLTIVFVAVRSIIKSKLSKFPPGPMRFPIIGSSLSLGNRPHEKLSQLKRKYGNIIAIDFGTRRGIVLNDYDTIQQAFHLKDFRSCSSFEKREEKLTGNTFSPSSNHEKQRAFALKDVHNFVMGERSIIEVLIVEELQKLFETFDKQSEHPVVNTQLFKLTSISVMFSKIMTGDHEGLPKWGNSFNVYVFFMPTISKLFLPFIKNWIHFVYGKNVDPVDKCFLSHPNNVLKDDHIAQNLIETCLKKIENKYFQGVFIDSLGVGADTVSSGLTWVLTVLIYYPEKQEKIQREIDKMIDRTRIPSLSERQLLPYVEAFVLEILRFSALLPLGIPQETAEDVKLDEYLIPKGTIAIPNVYEALHDPKRWDNPEKFEPERFLNKDETSVNKDVAQCVDIFFGFGKRIYPKEALAKDELFLLIAGLCQRYTFNPDPRCSYSPKITTELEFNLIPKAQTLLIHRR